MRIRERNQDSILPLLLAIALGVLGMLAQDSLNDQPAEVEVSAVQCDAPGQSLQC